MSSLPYQKLSESEVNLIVQPRGPDPQTKSGTDRLERACQKVANAIGKPVKLLRHQGLPMEFRPGRKRRAPRGGA